MKCACESCLCGFLSDALMKEGKAIVVKPARMVILLVKAVGIQAVPEA